MSGHVKPVETTSAERPLATLIAGVARAERTYARTVAHEMGVGTTDLYALGHLLSEDSTGVVDLGRRMGLGSAAATGLVDRLVAAGHVTKHRHNEDRRRVEVAATDTARDALLSRLAALAADTERLASTFTDTERAAISRFLQGVTDLYARHS